MIPLLVMSPEGKGETHMTDLFFIALSVGLFSLGAWYIKGLNGLEQEDANE